MKRKDRRKARKAITRKKRNARRAQEAAREDLYPAIRVDPGSIKLAGPDAERAVRALKAAISKIDFDDESSFSAGERRFYKLVKREGAKRAMDLFEQANADVKQSDPRAALTAHASLTLNLGEQILRRMPKAILAEMIPYIDFQVGLSGTNVVVKCSALCRASTPGGSVYYSTLRPTVEFEGRQYVIGYSRHAIDAICARLKPDRCNYGAAGDLTAYLERRVYVEPTTLYPEQPAMCLYDWCIQPGTSEYSLYVEKVMGEGNINWQGGIPYYKLGYCPLVFAEGFAVAKTFISPGFRSTPEYGLLLKARDLGELEKTRLMSMATVANASVEMIYKTGQFDHVKWFHQNGVRQVTQLDVKVFDYGRETDRKIFDVPALWERRQALRDERSLHRGD